MQALRSHPELTHLQFAQPDAVHAARKEQVLDLVKLVHSQTYLEHVQTCCRTSRNIGCDTYTNRHTYEVALLAASTWMQCVDSAISHGAAFALTRPPGHHALANLSTESPSTGFCVLNNAAIAARFALSKPEVSNVSIIDFDVHHGNGTEEAINHVQNTRFVSIHQADIYPKTGTDNRGGMYNHIMNVSLAPGSGYSALLPRLEEEIIPFLFEENPEVLILSAGFDALEKDVLGGLKFQPKDYRDLVKTLVASSGSSAFVFGLEGGYFVGKEGLGAALAECVAGYCHD